MPNKSLCVLLLGLSLSFGETKAQKVSHDQNAATQAPRQRAIPRQRVKFMPQRKATSPLPPSVDNSTSIYFPPIINQIGGSCAQAASIGYLFTYEMNRLLNRNAKTSADNRFSYLFAWNMLNEGEDQGGFASEGLFLAKQYGMMTQKDYGNSGNYQFRWASGYDKYLNAMRYRVESILVYDDSIPLMKRYLYDAGNGSGTGGIMVFSGMAGSWTINDKYDGPSRTGYHSLLTHLATDGSHAMSIVGYDDLVTYVDDKGTEHKGAFIVVNSWGAFTHDNGRFYLPYDFFKDPSVGNTQLSNQVEGVVVSTYTPQVVCKFTIDYSSRNDLSFGVGYSENADATLPGQFYYSAAFDHQGGDYPMQGQYLEGTIELALDITAHLDTPHGPVEAKRYFLNVVRGFRGKKKGEGKLLSLSVLDYRGKEPVEYKCRSRLPATLADGDNVFLVDVAKPLRLSVSPFRYTDDAGNATGETFMIRTAEGYHAKMKLSNLDSDHQQISIRYQVKE